MLKFSYIILYSLFSILFSLFFFSGCNNNSEDKVVIIGFDGADAHLLKKFIDNDYLPNIKKILNQGTYNDLIPTNPPEAPVVWTSFATGLNPGEHNIYSAIRRDPSTYFPESNIFTLQKPVLSKDKRISKPIQVSPVKKGETFWKIASEKGIKTNVIGIPFIFPPDKLKNGKMICGIGTPDLRGTQGTFFYFADDLLDEEINNPEAGGKLVKIELEKNNIDKDSRIGKAKIEGPIDYSEEYFSRLNIPVRFIPNYNNNSVTINLQGKSEIVKEGNFSNWFEMEFKMTPFIKIKGFGRFYIRQVSPNLKIYLTPLSYHPENSFINFSYPPRYSNELFKIYGLFKPLESDTWAFRENRIDEKTFFDDMLFNVNKKKEITIGELKREKSELFISIFNFTDGVSHLTIDSLYVLKAYQMMDEIVGDVIKSIDDKTTLIIFSPYSFNTFKKGVNINTLLIKNGLLALKDTLHESNKNFFEDVDWSKSKAYSLGTGQIYINLKGREKNGIVSQGKEYNELVNQIVDIMKNLINEETKESIIDAVYRRDEIFNGKFIDNAQDIQIAFKDGYRASFETTLGKVPKDLIVKNTSKWSSDHAGFNPDSINGFLICNKKSFFKNKPIDIKDISNIVLNHFKIVIPHKSNN